MAEVNILLVEDNKSDAQLVREALKEAGFAHRLTITLDGEEALRYVRGQDPPDLVLLDLNLPKLSGVEILKVIKSDPLLRMIPVIVLTNSTAPEDITSCYENYANAYIRKPVGFDNLINLITTTGLFWFKTVVLPGNVTVMQNTSLPPASSPKRRPSGTTRRAKK